MKGQVPSAAKPNLPSHLFWDFNFALMDWEKHHQIVMERVFERGTEAQWIELEQFYGVEKIMNALHTEIKFLPDYAIEKVCNHYHLKKDTLLCFTRKQSRKGYWI